MNKYLIYLCVLTILLPASNGEFFDELNEKREALEESLQKRYLPLEQGRAESLGLTRKIQAQRPQDFSGTTLSGRYAEYMMFHESTIFAQIEILYEGFAEEDKLKKAAKSLNGLYNPQSFQETSESTDLTDFYFSSQMIAAGVDPRLTATEVSNAVDARITEIGGREVNLSKFYTVPYDPVTLCIFWEAQKRRLPPADAKLVLEAVKLFLPAYELLVSEVDRYLTFNRTVNIRISTEGFRNKFANIQLSSTEISEHTKVKGFYPLLLSESPLVSSYSFRELKDGLDQLPRAQLETVILVGEFFLDYPSIFLDGNRYARENELDSLATIVRSARLLLEEKIASEANSTGDKQDDGGLGGDDEVDSVNGLDIEALEL